MLKIIKTEEPIKTERLITLIYGEPGLGKTSLSFTCNNPLLLDFDNGANRAIGKKDIIRIQSWTDIKSEFKSFMDIVKEYDTIIVDTVGTALEYIGAYVKSVDAAKCKKNNFYYWGQLKTEYSDFLGALTTLNKNIVLIAHQRISNSDEGKIYPMIPGGSYDTVMQKADLVGYIHLSNDKRIIDFNPSQFHEGKNSGNLKIMQIPAIADMAGFMQSDIIDSAMSVMNARNEAVNKANEEIQKFRDEISDLDTPESFNEYAKSILKGNKYSDQLRAHFKECYKRKGYFFNKETKEVEAETKAPPKAKEEITDQEILDDFNFRLEGLLSVEMPLPDLCNTLNDMIAEAKKLANDQLQTVILDKIIKLGESKDGIAYYDNYEYEGTVYDGFYQSQG